jgi:hypothetical protein
VPSLYASVPSSGPGTVPAYGVNEPFARSLPPPQLPTSQSAGASIPSVMVNGPSSGTSKKVA